MLLSNLIGSYFIIKKFKSYFKNILVGNVMIEVKDLTKDYHIRKGLFKPFNIVNAVKGVSFSINQGEKIGLIGLNGAGKSTLMKMMSGVLKPTSGSVRVNGFVPHKRENNFLKSIGVVMGQKSILLYDIPVKDSLKYYKEVYGIDDKTFKDLVIMMKF